MKCIYAIENKINHKKYIGMTNNFYKRKEHHLFLLRHNKHHSIKLQRAYNKYGEENFDFYVLLEVNEMKRLEIKEKEFIKKFDTYNNGYNCSEGGEKLPNYTIPETTRQALIKRNKETKPMLGKHLSEKHKKQISKKNSGKGNGMYGKKLTSEQRKKISEKSKKYWKENYDEGYKRLCEMNKSKKRRKEVSIQMSGENNFKAKIKKEDVIQIRKRYDSGEKLRFILKDYPMLTSSGLKKICYRTTWKNI